MARQISFGGGLIETPEPRYVRQRAMADALLQGTQRPVTGWGEGISQLANTAAAGFINKRADEAEKTATSARAAELQRVLASDDPMAALAASQDPELQGMSLQYRMAQAMDPQAVDNAKVWDPTANGGKGAMVYVPENKAVGMMAEAPSVPKLEAPPTRTRDVQGMTIQEEMQPDGTWQQIGARPTFAPNAPTQPPSVNLLTLFGPGGDVISVDSRDPALKDWLGKGYVERSPADPNSRPTEGESKNIQLYDVASKDLPVALESFDALSSLSNQAAGAVGADFMASEGYQRSVNAIKSIVQAYIYSVSGAQAPETEVSRMAGLVTPKPGEAEASIADKRARLQTYVDAIKLRLPHGYTPPEAAPTIDLGTESPPPQGHSGRGSQTPYQQKYGITPKAAPQ